MSGASSNAAGWFTLLEPAALAAPPLQRPDDPRLNQVIEPWEGAAEALVPGRAVVVGFPQDEGIVRNGGREGAARAPREIRQHLYRMTPFDPMTGADLTVLPPLDAGDVRIAGSLEESQEALAEVVGGVLTAGAVPVILGGGHETAYGHYLGYVRARRTTAIVNLDAHLDVRPLLHGRGHSGSPFRQALEHPHCPLPGSRYVCLGANPFAVAREHWRYAQEKGVHVYWADLAEGTESVLEEELRRLGGKGHAVMMTIDADVARSSDVPAVSAPNPRGLPGAAVARMARLAALNPHVASFDIVEINPLLDQDGQSARWAAMVAWFVLTGLAKRTPGRGTFDKN